MAKEIERVKFYCKPATAWWDKERNVDYEIMVRDADKDPTPSNLKFMGDKQVSLETENQFDSIKILYSRSGSNYYYYIGIPVGDVLTSLQIQAREIDDIFPKANMVDGELIGSFKFTMSGSHTRLTAHGNQQAGYCRYWISKYKEIGLSEISEQLTTCLEMLKGTDKDINMAMLIIESFKGLYHTRKFELGL